MLHICITKGGRPYNLKKGGSGLDKSYTNTLQSWRRLLKAVVSMAFDIFGCIWRIWPDFSGQYAAHRGSCEGVRRGPGPAFLF